MSTQVISPVTYIIVTAALLLLTVLTVGMSFVDMAAEWHLVSGLTIGVCKASLVGLFFMHLIHSPRTTWAVVIVTLFWLVAVLIGLTFTDYASRTAFPYTPGH